MVRSIENIYSTCLEEIALEGRKGCTFTKLWTLLPETPVSTLLQQLLVGRILKSTLIIKKLNGKDMDNTEHELSEDELDKVKLVACTDLRERALGIFFPEILATDGDRLLEAIGYYRSKGATLVQLKSYLGPSYKQGLNKQVENLQMLGLATAIKQQSNGKVMVYLSRWNPFYRYESNVDVQQIVNYLLNNNETSILVNDAFDNVKELKSKDKNSLRKNLITLWLLGKSRLEVAKTEPEGDEAPEYILYLRTPDETQFSKCEPLAVRNKSYGVKREKSLVSQIYDLIDSSENGVSTSETTCQLQTPYKPTNKLLKDISVDPTIEILCELNGKNKQMRWIRKNQTSEANDDNNIKAEISQNESSTTSAKHAKIADMQSDKGKERRRMVVNLIFEKGVLVFRDIYNAVVKVEKQKYGPKYTMDRHTLSRLLKKLIAENICKEFIVDRPDLQQGYLRLYANQELKPEDQNEQVHRVAQDYVRVMNMENLRPMTTNSLRSKFTEEYRNFKRVVQYNEHLMERLRIFHTNLAEYVRTNDSADRTFDLQTMVKNMKIGIYLQISHIKNTVVTQEDMDTMIDACKKGLTVAQVSEMVQSVKLKVKMKRYMNILKSLGVVKQKMIGHALKDASKVKFASSDLSNSYRLQLELCASASPAKWAPIIELEGIIQSQKMSTFQEVEIRKKAVAFSEMDDYNIEDPANITLYYASMRDSVKSFAEYKLDKTFTAEYPWLAANSWKRPASTKPKKRKRSSSIVKSKKRRVNVSVQKAALPAEIGMSEKDMRKKMNELKSVLVAEYFKAGGRMDKLNYSTIQNAFPHIDKKQCQDILHDIFCAQHFKKMGVRSVKVDSTEESLIQSLIFHVLLLQSELNTDTKPAMDGSIMEQEVNKFDADVFEFFLNRLLSKGWITCEEQLEKLSVKSFLSLCKQSKIGLASKFTLPLTRFQRQLDDNVFDRPHKLLRCNQISESGDMDCKTTCSCCAFQLLFGITNGNQNLSLTLAVKKTKEEKAENPPIIPLSFLEKLEPCLSVKVESQENHDPMPDVIASFHDNGPKGQMSLRMWQNLDGSTNKSLLRLFRIFIVYNVLRTPSMMLDELTRKLSPYLLPAEVKDLVEQLLQHHVLSDLSPSKECKEEVKRIDNFALGIGQNFSLIIRDA